MSYSFNLSRKGFTETALALVKRAEKSPYLQEPFIQVIDNNICAEFLSNSGKIIKMVVKPDGSYAIKTFASGMSGNALRSEYDRGVFRDLLRSIEIKLADKKSKIDVLQSQDFTGDYSTFKQYIREKGEKKWIADKRVH